MWLASKKQKAVVNARELEFAKLQERSDLLDQACGVGLWEAVLHQGDAMHAKSVWTWSPEFRRLVGYETEAEYPNVVQSWSDRLHPDDVEPTFAAFGMHLQDKSGRSRYDVSYRLKVRDGSYRWFRATGGCRHASDGVTVRACGSLTDIHHQKTIEAEMASAADADRVAIDALAAALDGLSAGDLTVSFSAPTPPKLAKLKEDFNAALERMRDTLTAVNENTVSIRGASNQITTATNDLSRRTEQQAANLEETAAALDEITATVRKTADGAKHARTVVGNARGSAEQSGQVVRQAVDAMSGIEASSREITQIIGVIDEIAFQTNLLALNAGVEAARAGEAGRGFAVVASEVRALAQRSAEAAKEIKALISTSGRQVEQGVAFVGQTGEALSRIVAQVAEIDGIVGEIASSAQEQATALDEVNTAVNQMDQVTQQNAAMVEETTAASHTLASEAEELSGLVGRFQLGGNQGAARHPAGRRPAAAGKPAAARPVAMMKSVGRGGAARKPVAAEADTDWQEF